MPELPEVEVVRAGLAPAVSGARVVAVEVLDDRALTRHDAASGDFEAIIGAVYLDAGGDAATEFVLRLVAPLLADPERFGAAMDPKTSLQEIAARRSAPPPLYTVTESGPDHNKHFVATVSVGDLVQATGEGTSKKQAEMAAALEAWTGLSVR